MPTTELTLSRKGEANQQHALRDNYLLSLMAALALSQGEQDSQTAKVVLAKLNEFFEDDSIDCEGIQNYLRGIIDKDLANQLLQVRRPDESALQSDHVIEDHPSNDTADDAFDITLLDNWVWERIFDFSREESEVYDGPNYFDYQEMAMAKLSMVSTSMRGFFKEKLTPLKFVLDGNFKALMAKVESDPELLLEVQTAHDHLGREYTCTPLEAIFKVGDPWMFDAVVPLIKELPNGEALLQAQFDNVFARVQRPLNKDEKALSPRQLWEEALDAKERELKADCFDFTDITNAIKTASREDVKAALDNPGANHGSALDAALATFKQAFHNQAFRELHANPFHLLKAIEIYVSQDFNGLSHDQCDLFWRQVIGHVERYLPAVDKQVFHQRLYETIQNNTLRGNDRLLHFKYSRALSMLVLSNSSGLGLHYAGDHCGTADGEILHPAIRDTGLLGLFGKLISSKKIKFTAIMRPKRNLQMNASAEPDLESFIGVLKGLDFKYFYPSKPVDLVEIDIQSVRDATGYAMNRIIDAVKTNKQSKLSPRVCVQALKYIPYQTQSIENAQRIVCNLFDYIEHSLNHERWSPRFLRLLSECLSINENSNYLGIDRVERVEFSIRDQMLYIEKNYKLSTEDRSDMSQYFLNHNDIEKAESLHEREPKKQLNLTREIDLHGKFYTSSQAAVHVLYNWKKCDEKSVTLITGWGRNNYTRQKNQSLNSVIKFFSHKGYDAKQEQPGRVTISKKTNLNPETDDVSQSSKRIKLYKSFENENIRPIL